MEPRNSNFLCFWYRKSPVPEIAPVIHGVKNQQRRVRGPGLQGLAGRVPSRGGTSVAVYKKARVQLEPQSVTRKNLYGALGVIGLVTVKGEVLVTSTCQVLKLVV
jgi:hypothetical protein